MAVPAEAADRQPLIEAIAAALGGLSAPLPPVVLDPVMISKSGYALLRPEARRALVTHLFPLAAVVTPNIHEAQTLLAELDLPVTLACQRWYEVFGTPTKPPATPRPWRSSSGCSSSKAPSGSRCR